MFKRLMIVALALMLVIAWSVGPMAQKAEKKAAKKAEYVGAKKCKMCHKDEHKSWLETKHAKAFDLLKPEEQKNDSCAVCHTTGFAVADTVFEGVQCEACHGPGSLYKSAKIMNKKKFKADRETQHKLAVEAGLIMPTEETCVGCHNKKSPTFKAFDYAKMKDKGIHVLPSAKPDSTKG